MMVAPSLEIVTVGKYNKEYVRIQSKKGNTSDEKQHEN
jgi:hypothetical protein